MEIKGVKPGQINTKDVLLVRPEGDFTIMLRALPLGFEEEVENILPLPKPPAKGFLKENGRLVRDAETNKPIPNYNTEDPAYVERRTHVRRMHTVAMLHAALDQEEKIKFDAVRPEQLDGSNADAFFSAIYAEIKAFGFTLGEYNDLVSAMLELSHVSAEEVEAKKGDFS